MSQSIYFQKNLTILSGYAVLFFLSVFLSGAVGCGNSETAQQKKQTSDNPEYQENIQSGDTALNNELVEEALKLYSVAYNIAPTIEAETKIAEAKEACYQKFYKKGVALMNNRNYLYAKKEFETAKLYIDKAEVNDLIKKCEAEIITKSQN